MGWEYLENETMEPRHLLTRELKGTYNERCTALQNGFDDVIQAVYEASSDDVARQMERHFASMGFDITSPNQVREQACRMAGERDLNIHQAASNTSLNSSPQYTKHLPKSIRPESGYVAGRFRCLAHSPIPSFSVHVPLADR